MSTLLLHHFFFIQTTFFSQKILHKYASFSNIGLIKALEDAIEHYKANNDSFTNIQQEILDDLNKLEPIVGIKHLSSIEKIILELMLISLLRLVTIFGPDIDQSIFGMEKEPAAITLAHLFEIFYQNDIICYNLTHVYYNNPGLLMLINLFNNHIYFGDANSSMGKDIVSSVHEYYKLHLQFRIQFAVHCQIIYPYVISIFEKSMLEFELIYHDARDKILY
ncbi:hypothetical protein COBT_001033 [Conglomerata obtusa]